MSTMMTFGAPFGALTSKRSGGVALRTSSTLLAGYLGSGIGSVIRTRMTAVGISVLGAVSSNAVQVVLASLVVFGRAARIIAPVFLAMGLATGLALGIFAERFAASSRWYARAREDARG